MDSFLLFLYVAQDIPFLRESLSDYQCDRSHWREQGFLFSQLGQLKASTRTLYEQCWRSRKAKDKSWGECGEYGGKGRYGEKGGQQVGNIFSFTSDNEKIKAIYGNYCLWSWLRYWHFDSADYITLMLLDKGYYDYDYEVPREKEKRHENSVERTQAMMNRFGFGKAKSLTPSTDTTLAEQLQSEVILEEKKKQNS